MIGMEAQGKENLEAAVHPMMDSSMYSHEVSHGGPSNGVNHDVLKTCGHEEDRKIHNGPGAGGESREDRGEGFSADADEQGGERKKPRTDDGPNGSNEAHEETSETAASEKRVREARKAICHDTTNRLQSILDKVKNTTKGLLSEIDVYLKSTEEVQIDYIKCQSSQRREAHRLESVEPDVAEHTARFLQQAQDQLFGAGGASASMMNAMMMPPSGPSGEAARVSSNISDMPLKR